MGSRYKLDEEELEDLERAMRVPRLDANERIRLLCIYWAGKGKEIRWICDTLFIAERTVYRYLSEYDIYKKSRNHPRNNNGRPSKLTGEQQEELNAHLESNIDRATKEIIIHIKQTYNVEYSEGGLAKWLKRNKFLYKRPRRAPHTVNVEKRIDFINAYDDLKEGLQDNEVILFIDGVHPDHQTQNVHGWIRDYQINCVSQS